MLAASWQCLREGEKVQSLYKKKKKCLSLSPVNQSLVILIYDATGPFVFFFGLKKKSIVSRPIYHVLESQSSYSSEIYQTILCIKYASEIRLIAYSPPVKVRQWLHNYLVLECPNSRLK